MTGIDISLEEVRELIETLDDNADGQIQMPEFLQLMSDVMKKQTHEEEMVQLFMAFGATDVNDVITVGDLDKALIEGGE